jgi:hypothetical protein
LEESFNRSGYLIDTAVAETLRTQSTQHATHWSVGERTSDRKTSASFLQPSQRNENEHDQRHSLIGFQSRFESGELGCEVDSLGDKIESDDCALERAHASVESGRAAAAG